MEGENCGGGGRGGDCGRFINAAIPFEAIKRLTGHIIVDCGVYGALSMNHVLCIYSYVHLPVYILCVVYQYSVVGNDVAMNDFRLCFIVCFIVTVAGSVALRCDDGNEIQLESEFIEIPYRWWWPPHRTACLFE